MAFGVNYFSYYSTLVVVLVICVQLVPHELTLTGVSAANPSNNHSPPKSPYANLYSNKPNHHSNNNHHSSSNNHHTHPNFNSDSSSNSDPLVASATSSGGNVGENGPPRGISSPIINGNRSTSFSPPVTGAGAGASASMMSSFLNGSQLHGNMSGRSMEQMMEQQADRMCAETGKMCRRGTGIDMKMLSLQMIRHDILRKLRMDENRLPNITGRGFPIPPDYINEFIDMQSDSPRDDYDDDHATTEKIIAFSRIQPLKISNKETRGVYYFTFSDKLSNMKIEKASLYIHVRTTNNYPHPHYPTQHGGEKKFVNFTIRLMEFVPQKRGESPMSISYGYFKPNFRAGEGGNAGHGYIRQGKSKWVQIDVRDTLGKWIAGTSPSSSRRIGLVIEAIDPNGQDVSQDVTLVSSNEMDVNSNPFIEVHVSEKGKSRPPRNIGMTCDENSQETRCCRYPLTVDFEDFGWDWIIAPKKYDANYCSGECPYAFLQKYPHNHIVQQAIPTGVGGPCCAARKMSSISMLYFDSDSNIVFSVLPGMVVDRCGCS